MRYCLTLLTFNNTVCIALSVLDFHKMKKYVYITYFAAGCSRQLAVAVAVAVAVSYGCGYVK